MAIKAAVKMGLRAACCLKLKRIMHESIKIKCGIALPEKMYLLRPC
jgi:hypothetical protein